MTRTIYFEDIRECEECGSYGGCTCDPGQLTAIAPAQGVCWYCGAQDRASELDVSAEGQLICPTCIDDGEDETFTACIWDTDGVTL